MRISTCLLTLATSTFLLAGCSVSSSDDDGTGGNGAGGGAAGGGGAGGSCYEATPANGVETGAWSMPNERATHDITVPADPGGGLVRLKVTVDHTDAIPWLNVHGIDDVDGSAVLSGSAVETANEQVWNGAFVAAPGSTYRLTTYEFFNAEANEHPVGYTLDWTFESIVDCYEPNDSLATASRVARGEEVEAYFVAGHRIGGAPESVLDHYAFDVDAPGTVTFHALTSPSNTTIRMRMFRPDESQIPGGGAVADGESMAFEVGEAGTYLVELRPEATLDMTVDQDDVDLPHFGATYRFRID